MGRCSPCAAAKLSTAAVVLRTHSRSSAPWLALHARSSLQLVAKRLMASSRNCNVRLSAQENGGTVVSCSDGSRRRSRAPSIRLVLRAAPALLFPNAPARCPFRRRSLEHLQRRHVPTRGQAESCGVGDLAVYGISEGLPDNCLYLGVERPQSLQTLLELLR